VIFAKISPRRRGEKQKTKALTTKDTKEHEGEFCLKRNPTTEGRRRGEKQSLKRNPTTEARRKTKRQGAQPQRTQGAPKESAA
jgi:hypothetical protein